MTLLESAATQTVAVARSATGIQSDTFLMSQFFIRPTLRVSSTAQEQRTIPGARVCCSGQVQKFVPITMDEWQHARRNWRFEIFHQARQNRAQAALRTRLRPIPLSMRRRTLREFLLPVLRLLLPYLR